MSLGFSSSFIPKNLTRLMFLTVQTANYTILEGIA